MTELMGQVEESYLVTKSFSSLCFHHYGKMIRKIWSEAKYCLVTSAYYDYECNVL